jgi:flagellar biosynthesis protein FliR
MNGRFPFDVFLIILLPFLTIAAGIFLAPLLMPEHVHHRLAVAIAVALAAILVISVSFLDTSSEA